MQKKAKIAILATGGTIAGSSENLLTSANYTAGVIGIETLIKALPELENLAHITSYQIANINSCDMNDELWLKLARKIKELFTSDTQAIVITHGTDTMEETAYFLSLVLNCEKAVILVGAMRPFTALSADGAKNLYNALSLASNAKAKGVMVVMNDRIYSPRAVTKTHTLNVNAFSSVNSGDLGYIIDGKINFYKDITQTYLKNSPFEVHTFSSLPKVDILYSYSNDGNAVAAKALFENGTKALIIAGSGAGNIHENHKNMLKELLKQGLIVVISSRVGAGFVSISDEDRALGFISAEDLNPQKARVLLMLALSKTQNLQEIQEYFLKY